MAKYATVAHLNAIPVAFVLSSNIHRRHMTKGQRAMAVATIYPDSDKGGRGKKTSGNLAEISGFSQRSLQVARTVIKFAPELAGDVLAGATPLDAGPGKCWG